MTKRAVRARARARSDRGQALVEFAMVLPILLILIFGIVDVARLYQAWVTMQGAAREAARYGVTGRTDCAISSTDRKACIVYLAEQLGSSLANSDDALEVSVRSWAYPAYIDPPTEGDPGQQCDALEVQVEYDFDASTPLIGNLLGPIHMTTTERLVNEPFGPCAQP